MEFQPIEDRVFVRRLDMARMKFQTLALPDNATEIPLTAMVVATGPGKTYPDGRHVPCHVKAGDIVVIGRFSGRDIELADEHLTVVRDADILAILVDEESNERSEVA